MQENPTRGVDLPALKTVLPKWVLTAPQAALLLAELPPLARTMAGVAMLTGLRRGELFALRWNAVNFTEKHLTVQEAVYEGVFGTPKTEAGTRRVPLAEATLALAVLTERQRRRIWKMSVLAALALGVFLCAIFGAEFLSGRPLAPEGMDFHAWLTFGLGVLCVVGGLYSLWSGPARRQK